LSERAEIVACFTCGSSDRDSEGRTRGERLIAALAAQVARPEVAVSSVRCLWSCSQSCAVHVRAAGKVSYVLARLEPNDETAGALLDWSALYARSTDGAVPFKTWPQALRGHFVCRIPAAPPTSED
jgi:predicted metal-binding protein